MSAETEKEMLNRLYQEYGLTSDNIFVHKHYKIITRAGIDKIQAKANIELSYKPIDCLCSPDKGIVTFLVKGTMFNDKGDVVAIVETTGEAGPANNTNGYPVAMAEKRGMSRAVLKLAGLYAEGFFGQDESDEFNEVVRTNWRNSSKKAEYKGE